MYHSKVPNSKLQTEFDASCTDKLVDGRGRRESSVAGAGPAGRAGDPTVAGGGPVRQGGLGLTPELASPDSTTTSSAFSTDKEDSS